MRVTGLIPLHPRHSAYPTTGIPLIPLDMGAANATTSANTNTSANANATRTGGVRYLACTAAAPAGGGGGPAAAAAAAASWSEAAELCEGLVRGGTLAVLESQVRASGRVDGRVGGCAGVWAPGWAGGSVTRCQVIAAG